MPSHTRTRTIAQICDIEAQTDFNIYCLDRNRPFFLEVHCAGSNQQEIIEVILTLVLALILKCAVEYHADLNCQSPCCATSGFQTVFLTVSPQSAAAHSFNHIPILRNICPVNHLVNHFNAVLHIVMNAFRVVEEVLTKTKRACVVLATVCISIVNAVHHHAVEYKVICIGNIAHCLDKEIITVALPAVIIEHVHTFGFFCNDNFCMMFKIFCALSVIKRYCESIADFEMFAVTHRHGVEFIGQCAFVIESNTLCEFGLEVATLGVYTEFCFLGNKACIALSVQIQIIICIFKNHGDSIFTQIGFLLETKTTSELCFIDASVFLHLAACDSEFIGIIDINVDFNTACITALADIYGFHCRQAVIICKDGDIIALVEILADAECTVCSRLGIITADNQINTNCRSFDNAYRISSKERLFKGINNTCHANLYFIALFGLEVVGNILLTIERHKCKGIALDCLIEACLRVNVVPERNGSVRFSGLGVVIEEHVFAQCCIEQVRIAHQ